MHPNKNTGKKNEKEAPAPLNPFSYDKDLGVGVRLLMVC